MNDVGSFRGVNFSLLRIKCSIAGHAPKRQMDVRDISNGLMSVCACRGDFPRSNVAFGACVFLDHDRG